MTLNDDQIDRLLAAADKNKHQDTCLGITGVNVDHCPQLQVVYRQARLLFHFSASGRKYIFFRLNVTTHAIVKIGPDTLVRRPFQQQHIIALA